MDLKEMIQLMEAMEEKGITKVALKQKGGFEVELERGQDVFSAPYHAAATAVAPPPSRLEVQNQERIFQRSEEPKKEEIKGGEPITSPMVGTYYASPSPEDDAFVKVGDKVNADTVVCIIEAMKVMNEVKAGKSGIVKQIHVNNADPVEFGTTLLTIG